MPHVIIKLGFHTHTTLCDWIRFLINSQPRSRISRGSFPWPSLCHASFFRSFFLRPIWPVWRGMKAILSPWWLLPKNLKSPSIIDLFQIPSKTPSNWNQITNSCLRQLFRLFVWWRGRRGCYVMPPERCRDADIFLRIKSMPGEKCESEMTERNLRFKELGDWFHGELCNENNK